MKRFVSFLTIVLTFAQLAFAQTPTISLTPNLNNSNYCVTAGPVALSGTPAGGNFSGPGVSGTVFNPSVAGAGAHILLYKVISNGVQLVASAVVVVSNPPVTGIFGLAGPYCVSSSTPIAMLGNPQGGTFSGNGVSGNFFRPATAGVGTHTITYTGNFGGCAYSTTTTVTVSAAVPTSVIAINGFPRQIPNNPTSPLQDVCATAPTIAMSGSPAGGTFSGTGVVGNIFNPSLAIGTSTSLTPFTISYAGSINGCAYSTTLSVNVVPTPNPTISGIQASYCKYTGFDANNNKIPNNTDVVVTFSTGVSGVSGLLAGVRTVTVNPSAGLGANVNVGAGTATFKPSNASTGTYVITYEGVTGTITNPVNPGCSFSTTFVVTISDLSNGEVSIQGLDGPYCTGADPITVVATPIGGTLAGPGVSGLTFNPTAAGAGLHPITYAGAFNGCPYSTSKQVRVFETPAAIISNLAAEYCQTDAPVNVTGTPSGGLFSGNGMTANVFTPASAGPGTHVIEYTGVQNGCTYSSTMSVMVTATPTPMLMGLASQYCISTPPVTISVSPPGGTLTGPGVTNGVFNPQAAGVGAHNITYSGTVGACHYTTVFTVNVSEKPTASFNVMDDGSALTQFCVNDNTDYTIMGTPSGGTYSGPGVNGANFNPANAGAGIHNITYAGESGGCTFTTTKTVTVNDQASITVTPPNPKVCANQSITLTASGGNSFTWQPATGVPSSGSTITIAPTATTTYTVIGTDELGCTGTATVTVTVIEPDGIASGTNVTVNNGTDGTATGTFTGLPAGTYTITLSSPNNTCTVTKTVVITEPDCNNLHADAGVDKSLCQGASATLVTNVSGGNGTYIYEWAPALGLSATNVKSPTAQPAQSTTYTVTVTDGVGCKTTDVVKVVISSNPTNASQQFTICRGGNVQLNVTGGASYVWSPSDGLSNTTIGNPVATPNFTTTYTVTVNGANQCNAIATVTVIVNPKPTVNVTPTDVTCETCSNGKLTVSATGGTAPYQYSLDGVTFQSSSTFTGLLPGDYLVYVVDNNGCNGQSVETNISVSIPVCDAPTTLTMGNISTTSATASWEASPNAISYEISYRPAGQADFTVVSTPSTSITLFNLTPAFTYELKVRSVCGNSVLSPYTGLTQFITANPDCSAPTTVSISSIATTSAVVSWTGVSGATGYIVEYRVVGSNLSTLLNLAINTVTLTGLSQNTAYEVRVRTVCGSATNLSPFTSFGPFNTLPSGGCSIPSGFVLTSVTQTAATISWSGVTSATSYIVRWKEQGSSQPFTNTTVLAPATSINLTNLTPNTNYVVSIRSRCGNTNSGFSNEFVFKTLPTSSGRMAAPPANDESDNGDGNGRADESVKGSSELGKNIERAEILRVYPNPNSGRFTVSLDAEESGFATVEVSDLTGRQVFSNEYLVFLGENEISVDLSGRSSGIYFLHFRLGKLAKTVRVTVR